MPKIEILPDAYALTRRAAELFIQIANKAMQTRGRFTVALAGGSTPKQMYALLTGADLDWSLIHIFWGDERCVPPNHPNSNYRMAAEAWLNHIPIPPGNLHRILGELPAEEAARVCEEELQREFMEALPRFDLILLGLGEDGHTASLFPESPAVHEAIHWTAAVHHRVPPHPLVDRVTLTPLVLNAADKVIFMVSGAEKSESLCKVLYGPFQPEKFPAQVVKLRDGVVRWLVDSDSAATIAQPVERDNS